MDKDAGWRIELKNVPHRSNIQIHIGNRIVDSLGCILVGKQISKDLCTLENSTEGFTDLKLAMASAAAPSAETDPEVPIQVTILDYFDGAKFLDSNLSARGLLSQEVIETSPPTRSDLDTLWTVNKGTADRDRHVSLQDIDHFAQLQDVNLRSVTFNSDIPTPIVSPGVQLGLDVAKALNSPSDFQSVPALKSLAADSRSTLLENVLEEASTDSDLRATLSGTILGGSSGAPILSTGHALMQQIPAEDQQLVLGVVGALQSADSTERSAVTSEIGSALAQRLVTGHETELATIENVTSGDATHISNLLLDDDAHLTDAVRLGTSLVEKIAGPDEAKKFEKIYGTVQQFQGLAVAFKLGTLSPASLLNGYVAAASILGALSGTSNSDNAPVLEALGKLSQQITEMRKEMDGRFDILEKGQQEILLKLDRVLQECVVNRVVMTDEIRNVENDQPRFRPE